MGGQKILVLGVSGMLGSMVYEHLSRVDGFDVYGTARTGDGDRILAFDASQPVAPQFQGALGEQEWDYIINCIGIIKPYCKDNDPQGVRNAMRVNAQFPHELGDVAKENGFKVIQIATDCVYSGTKGSYVESDPHDPTDVYGKTKSLGEVFDGSVLNIRCSIIGPERKGKKSLLEWFLSQPAGSELKGFTHHRWNGVTTLRFAQLCEQIIKQDKHDELLKQSHLHHYVPADSVDKHELLSIFQQVYGTDHKIIAVGDIGPAVDRTVGTKLGALSEILPPITIAEDVEQLREFTERIGFYDRA